MSQRSAWMAAAIATAEVSEPPRPSVVMRPVSLCTPWKPAITATSRRSLKRLISSAPLMSRMRAEAWALEVAIGSCQPCQERALMPIPSSVIASSPAVTCSPEDTTASYSRASCSAAPSRHQATSWLVTPDMAETTTATSWPASTSRLTWRATLRMRSVSATEVPPNFMTRRDMRGPLESARCALRQARARKDAYTYRRGGEAATAPLERRWEKADEQHRDVQARFHRRRGGGRALLGAGRGMVGCARQDGRAAQVQSGAARLHQGHRVPALRARW